MIQGKCDINTCHYYTNGYCCRSAGMGRLVENEFYLCEDYVREVNEFVIEQDKHGRPYKYNRDKK